MQGHIHKRVRSSHTGKATTTWYVVVELGPTPDGRRRQKWHGGYRTRKEAEAVRAKLVNEVNTGIYAAPSKMTLGEWLTDSWLPTMRTQIKASTWDGYDRLMRLHVVPVPGRRPLHQLTPPMLNNLYVELMESGSRRGNTPSGLNPKTVRHVHTTLHKAVADAIDAGLLTTNVAERAKPPKPRVASQTEMKFWDPEQLAKFLVHVEGTRLQAAWHLAAMTGMRRGEVLGLRWSDIDFQASRLAVRHTLVSVNYAIRDSSPRHTRHE
jgi:integrase